MKSPGNEKESAHEVRVIRHGTSRFKNNELFSAQYNLAVEEPLEIFVNDAPYTVTMRMPGDDFDLVRGFCCTEGLIGSREDVLSIEYCPKTPGKRRVLVHIDEECGGRLEGRRAYLSTSSCGLCGKSLASEIFTPVRPAGSFHAVSPGTLLALRYAFEEAQEVFRLTGSTHSVALFGLQRNLLSFAEDIGRHNAFDKAIGALVRQNRTGLAYIAIVSSRLSFEMVQKAGVLGVEILAGLSAPTSMAVSMAERLNITLIGFLREDGMSIYAHPERIDSPMGLQAEGKISLGGGG